MKILSGWHLVTVVTRQPPPPTIYILTLVKPFSFVWYVIPLLKTRALEFTRDLFQQVYDEKIKKRMTDCIYWPQYSPGGGVQWLQPKPWTSSIGQYARYCTGATLGPSKWQAKLAHFLSLFYLLFCWWLLGQYGASSCPMAASSGFPGSPGHAASGNAVCIAPEHRRGHQNGQRRRCICSSSSILSLTITIAK